MMKIQRQSIPMIRTALLTALLLVATAAVGATDAETPAWYDVEVLVFKNNTPESGTGEVWPADPGQPDLARTIELVPPAQSNPLPGAPQPFQQLDDASFALKGATAKLTASPNYRPLLHLAWRQPVTAQADAPAVHVYSDETAAPPEEKAAAKAIEGSIRISRNRFLHVDVDLLYRETGSSAPLLFGGEKTAAPMSFRLQQSRRINSGELHYFDHPAFGLLVKLTPYEIPGQKDNRGKPH